MQVISIYKNLFSMLFWASMQNIIHQFLCGYYQVQIAPRFLFDLPTGLLRRFITLYHFETTSVLDTTFLFARLVCLAHLSAFLCKKA